MKNLNPPPSEPEDPKTASGSQTRSKSVIHSELQSQKEKLQENRNQLKQMQQEEKARKLKMLQEQAQMNAKMKAQQIQQQQQQQQQQPPQKEDGAPSSMADMIQEEEQAPAGPAAAAEDAKQAEVADPVIVEPDKEQEKGNSPAELAPEAASHSQEHQGKQEQPPETSKRQSATKTIQPLAQAPSPRESASTTTAATPTQEKRSKSEASVESNVWVKAEDTYIDEGIAEGVKTFIVDQNAAENDAKTMVSLEEALAVCNHGDTILIRPGTYALKKSIVIDKCVQITGEDPKTTIFASKFDKCLPLVIWRATLGRISLISFVVHIRNRPRQSSGGRFATDSVLQVAEGQLRLEECDILISDRDDSQSFIKVDGVATCGQSQCWMNKCSIDGASSHAISLFSSSQVSLDATTLSSSYNAGVVCSGRSSFTMMRSKIQGVIAGSGLVAMDSSKCVIEDSEISNASRNGLSIMGRAQFLVRKSKILEIDGPVSACLVVSHGAVRGSCEDSELHASKKSELCICINSQSEFVASPLASSAGKALGSKAIELLKNTFVLNAEPVLKKQSLKPSPILCSGSSVRVDMKSNSYRVAGAANSEEKCPDDQKNFVNAKDNAIVRSVA